MNYIKEYVKFNSIMWKVFLKEKKLLIPMLIALSILLIFNNYFKYSSILAIVILFIFAIFIWIFLVRKSLIEYKKNMNFNSKVYRDFKYSWIFFIFVFLMILLSKI